MPIFGATQGVAMSLALIGLKLTYTALKPEILRLAFIDLYRMTTRRDMLPC